MAAYAVSISCIYNLFFWFSAPSFIPRLVSSTPVPYPYTFLPLTNLFHNYRTPPFRHTLDLLRLNANVQRLSPGIHSLSCLSLSSFFPVLTCALRQAVLTDLQGVPFGVCCMFQWGINTVRFRDGFSSLSSGGMGLGRTITNLASDNLCSAESG